MKDVLYMIAFAVILSPCLLILNESDTFVPNFIGLGYAIFLMMIAKRKSIKRFFEDVLKASDNITNKILK